MATSLMVGMVGFPIPTHAQDQAPAPVPQVVEKDDAHQNPDMPAFFRGEDFAEMRIQGRHDQANALKGIPYDTTDGVNRRSLAIRQLVQMERERDAAIRSANGPAPATWTELGPGPIPNGQTTTNSVPVSGRTTDISVHPTNPNIAYVGTAQGGLYRTLDGGSTWTQLMDNALSLAIGSVAISPSNPSTVFVGTGEANFSCDSFAGAGVYRIDNADTSPVVTGPLGLPTFNRKSVAQMLVHPNNPDIVFVALSTGTAGNACVLNGTYGASGLYRTMNATTAAPTFSLLTVTNPALGTRRIKDIVFDPSNPDVLLASSYGNPAAGDGGVFRTANATAPTPTFTHTLVLGLFRIELAAQHTGGVTTILAASGEAASNPTCVAAGHAGTVRRSVDGGVTWSTPILAADGFCGGQCFYDIAVAMKADDANTIYLGGPGNGTCGKVFQRSVNGGVTFDTTNTNLHADTHVIVAAPSDPNIMYQGNDGGIFKSTDAGVNWTSMNTAGFNATQFQSLALHPTNREFMIGGTQDNGTELRKADGTWTRADYGDGGYSAIDQSSTGTTSGTITMYHTYFNQANPNPANALMGFARSTSGETAFEDWDFLGCNGGVSNNGISCSDSATLFYAPMAQGPGSPNTLYFATDKLYRSANNGTSMTAVSQVFAASQPVSSIGISRQDDNVRIIGMRNGGIFATKTGVSPMTTIPGPFGGYVARAVIDPNNSNVAYITYSNYTIPAGRHIQKTSDLAARIAGTNNWTDAAVGIPDVPVSAFVIDPRNSSHLYAGTDIGVFHSNNGGTSWTPYGTGLPRVAVFDMAIQPSNNLLRIATHGRGIWEISTAHVTPPAISVTDAVQTEGDTGRTEMTFTLSLSIPLNTALSVDVTTADGTAIGGVDYKVRSAPGTVTFAAGETTKTVNVGVWGDLSDENVETFLLNLSNPVNATIADAQALATINDNDGEPSMSIGDATVTEGDTGFATADFAVTLTQPSGKGVTVDWANSPGTASASADYRVQTGTLSFGPGEATKLLTVRVWGDTANELDETYNVTLSNPVNATIADGAGLGTIIDDDLGPAINIGDVTVTEGDTGYVQANFSITLSAPSYETVSVNWSTADGTATGGPDYRVQSGTVTFLPGQVTKVITVRVWGDVVAEVTEQFFVNLASPVNGSIGDGSGTGTINSNE